MKKIFFILLIMTALYSCENFDKDHPDFDYTAGYFPYQFPVRTLVLGDYVFDNTNDNAHKFVISVAMGGVYENTRDRTFSFQLDESLCNNLLFSAGGNQVKAMPQSYYTLSSSNQIVIPKGKHNGGVEVQLTDAFFNDPLAITLGYVVPLRLTGSNDVDTILVGNPAVANADPRFSDQWNIAPKNFTMFAVKYINEYHGTYFHYGANTVKDAAGAVVENNTYSETYVEKNPTAKMLTTARHQVSLTTFFNSAAMAGEFTLLLNFNNNNVTVTAPAGADYTVTGSGQFKSKEYEWGNKKRDGITLTYSVTKNGNTYEASDVFVIRDRAVVMEVYSPVLN